MLEKYYKNNKKNKVKSANENICKFVIRRRCRRLVIRFETNRKLHVKDVRPMTRLFSFSIAMYTHRHDRCLSFLIRVGSFGLTVWSIS